MFTPTCRKPGQRVCGTLALVVLESMRLRTGSSKLRPPSENTANCTRRPCTNVTWPGSIRPANRRLLPFWCYSKPSSIWDTPLFSPQQYPCPSSPILPGRWTVKSRVRWPEEARLIRQSRQSKSKREKASGSARGRSGSGARKERS